jgi:putative flippase GtrA
LVLRYGFFAALATLANLAVQRLVLSGGNGAAMFASAMAAGTLAGLVIKYLLDKRWIFYDPTTGLTAHCQKFTLYTIMGLVTTAIFWGTETGFWLAWHSSAMREWGAVLGLTVGYVAKYNLDRRFVFTDAALRETWAK